MKYSKVSEIFVLINIFVLIVALFFMLTISYEWLILSPTHYVLGFTMCICGTIIGIFITNIEMILKHIIEDHHVN